MDVSGTTQSDIFVFEDDGSTPLAIPYEVFISVSNGSQVIAAFFGANGDLLSDGSKWSGSAAANIAANMIGTIGHTNQMNFAKLLFACLQGWVNSQAMPLQLKIQSIKNGEISQNDCAILTMGLQISEGTLFAPRDLDLFDGIFYSSNLLTENLANSGITNILESTWSRNNMRNQIASAGVHARAFADSASPTGISVIFSKVTTDRTLNYRSRIMSYDADGFPNYEAGQDINGPGDVPASDDSPSRFCIVPALQANDMPVIVLGKGTQGVLFRTGSIIVNSGTAAVPDYSNSLSTSAIDSTLNNLGLNRADAQGRVYVRHFAGGFTRLSRLAYSGTLGDVPSLINVVNWSSEQIGVATANTPALGGTGATAQFSAWGVAIDEVHTENSEPVAYVSDNINHVIWEVKRNVSPVGPAGWDWTIWAGQTGVAGNTNGVGTAATFDTPTGIVYDPVTDAVYVSCLNSKTIRKITRTGVVVTKFFGQVGVGGHDNDQFAF